MIKQNDMLLLDPLKILEQYPDLLSNAQEIISFTIIVAAVSDALMAAAPILHTAVVAQVTAVLEDGTVVLQTVAGELYYLVVPNGEISLEIGDTIKLARPGEVVGLSSITINSFVYLAHNPEILDVVTDVLLMICSVDTCLNVLEDYPIIFDLIIAFFWNVGPFGM
jgi:hypothetical protein